MKTSQVELEPWKTQEREEKRETTHIERALVKTIHSLEVSSVF